MANPEHVELLDQGIASLNKWREENAGVFLDLEGTNLRNANLIGANLSEANLSWANLSEANLSKASLSRANLSEANLTAAKLPSARIVEASLRKANLSEANLSRANLIGANLSEANLIAADLTRAVLTRADLSGADLTQADLSRADLTRADLSRADLTQAGLFKANFQRAKLQNTKLWDCHFGYTYLTDLSLLNASFKGIRSSSRCIVDGQTFQNSNGVPTPELEEFFRVIGLERWEIESAKLYDPALSAEEVTNIQYKIFDLRTPGAMFLGGVFISYAHEDFQTVEKIYDALRQKDITTFLDRHDFKAGTLNKNIDRTIRRSDHVVVVLSESSLKSKWVWHEIESTFEKEDKEDRIILYPVRVDDYVFEPKKNSRNDHLYRELVKRVILDFANPSEFDTSLRKLVEGMKEDFSPEE